MCVEWLDKESISLVPLKITWQQSVKWIPCKATNVSDCKLELNKLLKKNNFWPTFNGFFNSISQSLISRLGV